jgi:predicted membrane channel-forming protein YqfA (hemolysin III family)
MYQLSEQQIDFIFNDISARGVEMESLQQNLLDHICCIIENNLEENGDFESFYQTTIEKFYKDELWEIEEETLQLLTFKNYYTMKKVMIVSGTFSAAAMILGILFKFLHWPGASALIILGIGISSLIFLPLLFTLKIKEQQNTKDKIGLGLITMSGILLCLSVLFKVMHWPGANILGVTFIIVLGLLFLPFNFYSGIRNPERKTNTITMSILIIIFCGLWLTLIRTPQASKFIKIDDTHTVLVQEQILTSQINYLKYLKKDSLINIDKLGNEIFTACNILKTQIIKHETGFESIPNDFENKEVFIESHDMVNLLNSTPDVNELLSKITALVEQYNNSLTDKSLNNLPVNNTFIEYYKTQNFRSMNTINLLKQINNIQMLVLQNQELL